MKKKIVLTALVAVLFTAVAVLVSTQVCETESGIILMSALIGVLGGQCCVFTFLLA